MEENKMSWMKAWNHKIFFGSSNVKEIKPMVFVFQIVILQLSLIF